MLGARGAFGSSLSEPRSYNEAEVEFSFSQPTIDLFYQPWRSGVRDSWKQRISGLVGWLTLGKAYASKSIDNHLQSHKFHCRFSYILKWHLSRENLAWVHVVDVVVHKDAPVKVGVQDKTRNTGKNGGKWEITSRKPHQSPTQQHTPVSGCKKGC